MSKTSCFKDIAPIRYRGPDRDDPLAFRHDDKRRVVLGKRMEDHLAGWNTAHGQAVLAGRVSLSQLADQVLAANVDVQPVSGRQEALENLVNRYCGN